MQPIEMLVSSGNWYVAELRSAKFHFPFRLVLMNRKKLTLGVSWYAMKLLRPLSFDSFFGEAKMQEYGGFTLSQLYFPSPLSYKITSLHGSDKQQKIEECIAPYVEPPSLTTTCMISASCTLAFNFPRT